MKHITKGPRHHAPFAKQTLGKLSCRNVDKDLLLRVKGRLHGPSKASRLQLHFESMAPINQTWSTHLSKQGSCTWIIKP